MKLILEVNLDNQDIENPGRVISAIRLWATRCVAATRLIEADLYPYKPAKHGLGRTPDPPSKEIIGKVTIDSNSP